MMSVGHVLDHVPDHMIIGLVTTALQYEDAIYVSVYRWISNNKEDD